MYNIWCVVMTTVLPMAAVIGIVLSLGLNLSLMAIGLGLVALITVVGVVDAVVEYYHK